MASCLTEIKSEMIDGADIEIVAYEYWDGYDDSVKYFVAVHDFDDVANIDYPTVEDIDAWDREDLEKKFREAVRKYPLKSQFREVSIR